MLWVNVNRMFRISSMLCALTNILCAIACSSPPPPPSCSKLAVVAAAYLPYTTKLTITVAISAGRYSASSARFCFIAVASPLVHSGHQRTGCSRSLPRNGR